MLRSAIAACDCVLYGAAPGVDEQAEALARELNKDIIAVPALWTPRGKSAGPIRNSLMVLVACALKAAGHHVMFGAFPAKTSSGTWDCIRKLRTAGIEGAMSEP